MHKPAPKSSTSQIDPEQGSLHGHAPSSSGLQNNQLNQGQSSNSFEFVASSTGHNPKMSSTATGLNDIRAGLKQQFNKPSNGPGLGGQSSSAHQGVAASSTTGFIGKRERSRSGSKEKHQTPKVNVSTTGQQGSRAPILAPLPPVVAQPVPEAGRKPLGSKERSSSHFRRRETPHYTGGPGDTLGKYTIEEHIADGTFGRCFRVKRGHGDSYAAKVIKPVKKYIEAAQEEITMLRHMNTYDQARYSPQYIESFTIAGHLVIITTLHGESLYKVLKNKNPKGFPLPVLRKICLNILNAVEVMHSKAQLAHTDLKPENIVFNTAGRLKKFKFREKKFYLPRDLKIRLIDFGNAIQKEDFNFSTINTRQFRAPEVIMKHQKWDFRSDIWSVGCIIMELFTGKILFPTSNTFEHLLMIEKVLGEAIPADMVIQSKNREVRPLFDVDHIHNPEKRVPGSPQGSCLVNAAGVEGIDLAYIKNMQTLGEIIDVQENQEVERNLFKDLIAKLLKINPKHRISLADAIQHPFFDPMFEQEYQFLFDRVQRTFDNPVQNDAEY